MSIHDIRLRWYDQDDRDGFLRKLTPIDQTCSTLDLISTMKKYHDLSNENYRCYGQNGQVAGDLAQRNPYEQLFKTLVVFH